MNDTAQDRSVTSSVEVAADPETAFLVFTEELDLWWVRGPINHHAAGKTLAMRCEPGVGGRLLEVYPDDALELGRITEWEPGKRLAWLSSVDDVRTEVTFEPSTVGTLVTVRATIPAGGKDKGGTSWTRTVPRWLGPWIDRRDTAPHAVSDIGRLGMSVAYARPAAAAHWLHDVLGFRSPDPLPTQPDPLPETGYGHPWIEFRIGTGSLIIAKQDGDRPTGNPVIVPWVYVDDIAAHYDRAVAGGATMVSELSSPWGLPFYVAEDPEGNHWTIAQARPTM